MKPEIIANRKIVYCDSEGISREWDSDFDIRDAKYYPDEDLLVVILQKDGDSQYLKGVNPDGTLRFEVNPPKDYFLYYLSSHVRRNVAVVCVSDKERFDWFFGINPMNGELTSLNRAY